MKFPRSDARLTAQLLCVSEVSVCFQAILHVTLAEHLIAAVHSQGLDPWKAKNKVEPVREII